MNGLNLEDLSDKSPNSHPFFKSSETALSWDNGFYAGPTFHHTLSLERKRAKRSKRHFLLILLHVGDLLIRPESQRFVKKIENALSSCVRETDIKGWYQQDKIISIIFTEIANIDEIIKEKILLKVQDKLFEALGPEAVQMIRLAYSIFPETHPGNTLQWFHWTRSQELLPKNHSHRFLLIKKARGLVDSLVRLFLLSPYSSLGRPSHQASPKNTGFFHAGK